MTTGAYISGAAHLILILWVVLGGVLFRAQDRDMLDSTNVQLLSEDEYQSLTATRQEPDAAQDAPEMSPPGTEENTANPSPGDAPPEMAPRPEIATAADPDAQPEAPDLSVPVAAVDESVPDAPVAPVSDEMVALLPAPALPGRPKDAPRVAPLPAPEAPPATQEAPEFVRPTAPVVDPTPEAQPTEEEPPAAPEETTSEIVTEADAAEPEGAKVTGFPPRLRPPSREVAPSDPAPSDPAPSEPASTASGTAPSQPGETTNPELPVGPPLSYGEVNKLVAAMEQCWRPGMLSTDAARSTVVVGVSMKSDGTPIASSIRMIDASGPDDVSVKRAYETAVRAVRRCGLRGFPLPIEKYAHWAEIEITFSPDEGLLFQ